jgi:hypothetical protein
MEQQGKGLPAQYLASMSGSGLVLDSVYWSYPWADIKTLRTLCAISLF